MNLEVEKYPGELSQLRELRQLIQNHDKNCKLAKTSDELFDRQLLLVTDVRVKMLQLKEQEEKAKS